MPRHLRKVALILMSLIPFTLGACDLLNRSTAEDTVKALRARYGEEFAATHIGNRMDYETADLYVHPAADERVVFTAQIDHDGNVTDDYLSTLALNAVELETEAALRAGGVSAAVSAVFSNPILDETDRDLDADAFARKYGREAVLFRILVSSEGADPEAIIRALEDVSRKHSFKLVVYGFVLEPADYAACAGELLARPSLGLAEIKAYHPVRSFDTVVAGGVSRLTAEALRTEWEGR